MPADLLPPATPTNPVTPPPIDTDNPDAPPAMDDSGVTLTADQAMSAGLSDAQPGDTFTATLTVKSSDPTAGVTLSIEDAKSNSTPDDAAQNIPTPKQKVLGPEAVFGSGGPGNDY